MCAELDARLIALINDVVDLAMDYDNAAAPLRLHWSVTHGPATWEPYPLRECH